MQQARWATALPFTTLSAVTPAGGFPAPYCAEAFSNNVEPISRVLFAGIDNASATTVGSPATQPQHQDFTAVTGTVDPGASYSIAVEGNTDGDFTTAIMAYVDWNQDGTFAGDELYQVGTLANSTGADGVQAVGSIAVPATALAGDTRLRVQKKYTGTTPPTFPTPCNTAGYGQAEDYTITVTGGGGGGDAWDFDDVTAPALPADWTSTFDGSGVAFVTQTTLVDTAPNAAFAPEQVTVGNSYLDSPAISVPATGGVLNFRFAYNLETGFDGAVLEIAINGGAFTDIVTAGGSFTAGGYNGTISTSWGSPIGGRQAWTGEQTPAYATSTVELPLAAAGQSVVLRWRVASDSSVAADAPNGLWVDTIELTAGTAPTDPVIAVTPGSLSFSVAPDATGSSPLTIANDGGGTLNFTIDETAPTSSAPRGYESVLRSRSGRDASIDIGDVSFGKVPGMAPQISPKGPVQVNPLRGREIELRSVETPFGTAVDISQTASNAPEALNGVGCGSGDVATGSTADNSWWRRFYFDEHSISGSAQINTVTVATEAGPNMPVTINVYTIPSSVAVDTIPTAQLTLIGTGTGTVGGTLTTTTVPITGATIADTSAVDLVVEYHVDGVPAGSGRLFPGGNPSAQTHTAFISSTTCAITTPTPTAGIGFPDFHLVMVVNVSPSGGPPAGCDSPTDVPWLSVTPASGSVGPVSSTDVSVGVDATGLTVGESYTATLCVASNDAANPLVQVPVTLDVTAPCPSDRIYANGFDDESNGSCGGSGPAVYTDRTAFLAAIGATFYEEAFTSIPTGPVNSPMPFSGSGYSYTVFTQAGAVSGLYNDPGIVSTDNAGDQIVITFTTPVNAVGGNFWATDVSVAPTGTPVVVTLSDGTVETVTVTGASTFRGFTTSAPITSLTIDAPEAVPGSAPFFWSTLDNLIVGSAN
ncbi:MAG TPA: GEVED domain-containing protein [Dokdonella sp.]|uniref:GEVED domain-containing protein n=1 Tax=Dokdonella sp. TaxID=2291710 RepID=UPI002D168B4D|nr:GEVED domain-containing protein [Dokdonella sp.]HUD41558.1 GEVED domain-containing protein [Dokdonella sp.]